MKMPTPYILSDEPRIYAKKKQETGWFCFRFRLLLVIQGYVPFSRTATELLFEVISRAYERLSLIVTTNLPFEAWVEIFGCERLTEALLDRLTHRVHIIEANGPSYRLRQSKRRLQKGDVRGDDDDPPEPTSIGSGDA